ncbi:MAG TPA: response regulator [Pyrinomonadaceae bacterium]|nr:response regulator [Pyrinomonadaceae bacterium]
MENSDRPTGVAADRPTIMVADDYDDVRSILKSWLEQHNCRVIEAVTGQEAVQQAERERPDLILMDLAMPEVDGFGAVFLIRTNENLRDVPIIGISAYGELGIDAQLKIDPKAVGFNDYLEKPFAAAKLYELVDRYLPERSGVLPE